MRETAAKHKGNVSFVWTFPGSEGAADLLQHLRCKPRDDASSETFAVLEDFENDYRRGGNVPSRTIMIMTAATFTRTVGIYYLITNVITN